MGQAGLRHCAEYAGVRDALVVVRSHRAPRGRPRLLGAIGAALVSGLVTVSGWYTAAGASAVAQMIGP